MGGQATNGAAMEVSRGFHGRPFPEDWQWLYDLDGGADGDPPPTSPMDNLERDLPIALLSCNLLGADTQIELGRLMTELGLYTLWFLEHGKRGGWGIHETVLLMSYPHDRYRMVWDAWIDFKALDDFDGPPEVEKQRRDAATDRITALLQQAMADIRYVRENLPRS
jgi:hypothetical protein